MKEQKNKCVMCEEEPELRVDTRTNEEVKIYFLDPINKQQLCEKCNKINNDIYSNKGERYTGILKVIRGQNANN